MAIYIWNRDTELEIWEAHSGSWKPWGGGADPWWIMETLWGGAKAATGLHCPRSRHAQNSGGGGARAAVPHSGVCPHPLGSRAPGAESPHYTTGGGGETEEKRVMGRGAERDKKRMIGVGAEEESDGVGG